MNTRITQTRSAFAVLALSGLLLSACGTSASDAGDTDDSRSSDTAFPATVEGFHGDVTMDNKPERVVALTAQSAEILVALGIEPVAVGITEDGLDTSRPWLVDAVEDVYDPELVQNWEINLERVASYEPDLIVGWAPLFEEDVYEQAQDIATTFPGLAEGHPLPPWDTTTKALATLTGTDADSVLAKVEESCAAAAAEIPQWSGRTYQWLAAYDEQLTFGNGAAFECFGLTPAPNQDNTLSGAGISYENLDDLNADFVGIVSTSEFTSRVQNDPRYENLPSARADAVLWIEYEAPLAHSINVAGPLSFDYLIREVLPVLQSTTPAS